MAEPDESVRTEARFEAQYYARHDVDRRWRHRGDKPLLYRSILRLLAPWRGGRLLDVGCGEGRFLFRSATQFESHGLDVSEAGVAAARALTGLDTISVGSATALPFGEGGLDVVVCLDVLEHLPAPEEALAEARRVLRPGGALFVSTPNVGSLGYRRKGQRSFMFRDETHVSLRSAAAWRALIGESGFGIRTDGTDTLWDPPYLGLPRAVERLPFLVLSQAMFAIRPMYPWRLGENYLCLAVRR